jgi:hypothetical protein
VVGTEIGPAGSHADSLAPAQFSIWDFLRILRWQGLKPSLVRCVTARLKSCPDTKQKACCTNLVQERRGEICDSFFRFSRRHSSPSFRNEAQLLPPYSGWRLSAAYFPELIGSAPVAIRLPFPRFPPRSPRLCCCKYEAARRENTTFPFGLLHAIGSASEQTQSQRAESLRDKFSWVPLQGAPRRMS